MSSELPIRWRAFTLAKRGHKAEEYEDAFAADAKVGRFAVADGASESSFANRWAQLLVEAFTRPAAAPVLDPAWLDVLRKRWSVEVDNQQLAWYADEKRILGAYATFAGLALKVTDQGGRWKTWAVGDSCIFQVRKDRLVQAFPLSKSADFGLNPALLGSRPDNGKSAAPRQQTESGAWEPGDRFYLMTDALAQWFLKRNETELMPWKSLAHRLKEPKNDALVAYCQELRDRDEMRNDDVTLIVVEPQAQE